MRLTHSTTFRRWTEGNHQNRWIDYWLHSHLFDYLDSLRTLWQCNKTGEVTEITSWCDNVWTIYSSVKITWSEPLVLKSMMLKKASLSHTYTGNNRCSSGFLWRADGYNADATRCSPQDSDVHTLTSFTFAEYGWPIFYGVTSRCNINRYGKPTDRRTAPACVEPDIQIVAHRDKRRLY